MAKIFILKISESYPESYWFKSKILTGQDSILLKTGVEVNEELLIEFTLTSRASIDKVLKYDFFSATDLILLAPDFISYYWMPRLWVFNFLMQTSIWVERNMTAIKFSI